jgi:4-methyl-5(b-hydroxyethyl)-thiazole monophosphate biosynthesis
MPTAIVVFAQGFEEIEAITQVDILRRADAEVELVGLDEMEVTGSRGVTVKMDRLLSESEDVDLIALPGGSEGAKRLGQSSSLLHLLRRQLDSGKLVGAICAAPALVLGENGLLSGRRATCFPGFEDHFTDDAEYVIDTVVKDGNLITSRGPGTALPFALALARELVGEDVAERVASAALARSMI